jgi:hypothetical protein
VLPVPHLSPNVLPHNPPSPQNVGAKFSSDVNRDAKSLFSAGTRAVAPVKVAAPASLDFFGASEAPVVPPKAAMAGKSAKRAGGKASSSTSSSSSSSSGHESRKRPRHGDGKREGPEG